jgi:hypothetical protein
MHYNRIISSESITALPRLVACIPAGLTDGVVVDPERSPRSVARTVEYPRALRDHAQMLNAHIIAPFSLDVATMLIVTVYE